MQIPKQIHYCWFGRNPLPESAQKCIASWRKFFPGYEIIEWNEDNFDVNSIPYTAQAYQSRKYAFVSDYARFKILYEHGGIYFDTDVEVIRPMDDIVGRGPFMGFEINPDGEIYRGAVNPGLGIAAFRQIEFYKRILEYYSGLAFLLPGGKYNITDAVVNITTRELVKAGLKCESGIQTVAGITVYPSDYFNPFDDATGRLNLSKNTCSIHWYSKTWIQTNPIRQYISRLVHRIFGVSAISNLRQRLKK